MSPLRIDLLRPLPCKQLKFRKPFYVLIITRPRNPFGSRSLNGWRYAHGDGPETERLREEAIDREHWSAEKWTEWQNTQLAALLHRAATRVPYYRDLWNARKRQGDNRSWEYLENWPVLEKESLRQNPKAFLADGCDARRMFRVHTSGTTGTPLDVWYSKSTARAWYALFEAPPLPEIGMTFLVTTVGQFWVVDLSCRPTRVGLLFGFGIIRSTSFICLHIIWQGI